MAGPKKSAAPAPIPETLSTSHPGIAPALSMHVPDRAEPVASTMPSSQSPTIASSVALTRHTAPAQDITQSTTSMTQPTITAKDKPTGISASLWAGEVTEDVANKSRSNADTEHMVKNEPTVMKRDRGTDKVDTKGSLRQRNRHALNFANALGLKLNSNGGLRRETSACMIRGNGNSEREGRGAHLGDQGNSSGTTSASRGDNKRQEDNRRQEDDRRQGRRDHQARNGEALGFPPETTKQTGKVEYKKKEPDRQGQGRLAQGEVPLPPKNGSKRSEGGRKDRLHHEQNSRKTPKAISTPGTESARAPHGRRADSREAVASRGATDKSALTNLTAESKRSSGGNGVTNEQPPSQKSVGLGTSLFARQESPPPHVRDDNTDTTSRHPNQTFTFQELRDKKNTKYERGAGRQNSDDIAYLPLREPVYTTSPSYVNRLPITTPPPPAPSTPVSSPAASIGYMPNPTSPEFVPSASVTRTMTPTSDAKYDASSEFSLSTSAAANIIPTTNAEQVASPRISAKQNASPEPVPSVSVAANMSPISNAKQIASPEWVAEQDALRAERQRDRERYEEITRSALETLRKFDARV